MELLMYPTLEVRWFHQGQIPPEVLAWFGRLGPLPEEQPARVDHYLRLPDNDALGVKLREGRLEIKQREDEPRRTDFHPRVSGTVEQWRKWSFPLAESDPGLAGPDTAWIAVEKNRQLRRYRVSGDRPVEAVFKEAEPAQGCELELSRLQAAGQLWWSVCFEAFGDEANFKDYLRLTVQYVVRLAKPPMLEIGASYSYPAWLRNIV
jgi:hypothetical protein